MRNHADSTLLTAVLQADMGHDLELNKQIYIQQITQAANQGAKLIVLPELFYMPYFCQHQSTQYFAWAEMVPGPLTDELGRLAKQLSIVLIAPLFEKRAKGLYHNTAVVFEQDGSIAGIYRKMHIPDDPGFYEKYYFTPGDLGFTPIKTSVANLGVLICWDQWFPEAARLMALAGAELLIYPTAIGWDPRDDAQQQMTQQQAWETVQRGHSVANLLPVISCNRVGFEQDPTRQTAGIQFWGNSFITGSQGNILAKAQSAHAEQLITHINLIDSEQLRQVWPFFRDRRIDSYDGLQKLNST